MASQFNDSMHFKQFHFFKCDLQKGPKCYEKMHGLGIIQKVQQYLKLVRIFWRNCLEFFSSQVNGVLGYCFQYALGVSDARRNMVKYTLSF